MAQNEYQSPSGPYVEAMRTVRGVKNLFFAILAVVILFLVVAFCLVQYLGVLGYESKFPWENWLSWAFSFATFLGIIVGCLYVLTLLIGLKISLAGRLEGAAGLTKGFFWSLLFLAIFLPWQHLLMHHVAGGKTPMLGTVPGVLYGFDELLQKTVPENEQLQESPKAKQDTEAVADTEKPKLDISRQAVLAVRFILYPIAALLLLVAAQSRYRPQRVEMPEPVVMSRLTERTPEKPQ